MSASVARALLLVAATAPAASAAALLRASAASAAALQRDGNAEHSFVYDYSKHGEDWVQGTCSSRSRQSPIDLPTGINMVPQSKFTFSYDPIRSPFELVNNGHTLSADLRYHGFGGISFADTWYDVMYINVHAVSEHTFGGAHRPLEIHLVHKRYDSDALLIVAIPVDSAIPPPAGGAPAAPPGTPYQAPSMSDPNYNSIIQALLRTPAPGPMMKAQVPGDELVTEDLGVLLANGVFYGYAGSTTAPPCAENVAWLVRASPVLVSDIQARYLYDAVFASTNGNGNYRSTMPLEGREITLYSAVRSSAPLLPAAELSGVMASSQSQADPDYLSKKWARDAMRTAAASLDYVRNLDTRLHRASHLSSAVLKPGDVLGASPGPAPAPAPAVAEDPRAAAMAMAGIISKAAQDAVQNASIAIAEQAHDAAITAARTATEVVMGRMIEHDKAAARAREQAQQEAVNAAVR